MQKIKIPLNLLLISLVILTLCPQILWADSKYEKPPTFKVQDLLPAEAIKADNYKISEQVRSDGYFYHFVLESDYGNYFVIGQSQLDARIHELAVLDQLTEFTDSKVFLDSAKKAGIDIVTAPIRAVGTIVDAASNPDKTYQAIKKVPQGVAGLFSSAYDSVKKGAKSVSNSISGSDSSSSSNSKNKSGSSLTDQGTEMALSYIKYSDNEAEWYKRYNLDPYTVNKPLREKISRITTVQTAVKFSTYLVPGVPTLSVISTTNRVLSGINKLAIYADPKTIKDRNQAILKKLGVSPEAASALLDDEFYSPTLLAIFCTHLEQLAALKDLEILVKVAATNTHSPEAARFYTENLIHLTKLNQKVALTLLVPELKVMAAVNQQGQVVVPLALDYLTWRKELDLEVRNLQKQLVLLKINSKPTLYLSGKLSPLAKKQLEGMSIGVSTLGTPSAGSAS